MPIAFATVLAQEPASPVQIYTTVADIAKAYVTLRVQYDPIIAGLSDYLETSTVHLPARSPAAIAKLGRGEDALLRVLPHETELLRQDPNVRSAAGGT